MFYLKVEVTERYSTWTEFREIEFFDRSGVKIPVSELAIVESNFTNTTYPISRAIDNDIPSGRGSYVADQGALPHYVIISSKVKFGSVKWHDDGWGGYASKTLEFYSSNQKLSRYDKNWILKEVVSLPNTNFQVQEVTNFNVSEMGFYIENEGKFFSLDDKTVIKFSTGDETIIRKYLVDRGQEIDLSVPFNKLKILKSPSASGASTNTFDVQPNDVQTKIKKISIPRRV